MKKRFFFSVLILISSSLFAMGSLKSEGSSNHDACVKLKPGIYLKDLIAAMGPAKTYPNRENTFFFESGILGGVIHGVIDPQTEKVLKLHCGIERAPYEWDLTK